MRVGLFDFQEDALVDLQNKPNNARPFTLDVGKQAIRKKVLAVSSNHQLDQMFD